MILAIGPIPSSNSGEDRLSATASTGYGTRRSSVHHSPSLQFRIPYAARQSPSKGNPTDPTLKTQVGPICLCNGRCVCPQQSTLGVGLPSISNAFSSRVEGRKPSALERGEP